MSYKATIEVEFPDEETAAKFYKKGRQMGGTVNVISQSFSEEVAIVKAVPKAFYHLYAILRGEEVGYIGQTRANPPTARLDQHIKTAQNPFYPWLKEGLDKKDIHQEFYVLGEVSEAEARQEERFAIRRLQPLYNKNEKMPMLNEQNGNVLAKALEGRQ